MQSLSNHRQWDSVWVPNLLAVSKHSVTRLPSVEGYLPSLLTPTCQPQGAHEGLLGPPYCFPPSSLPPSPAESIPTTSEGQGPRTAHTEKRARPRPRTAREISSRDCTAGKEKLGYLAMECTIKPHTSPKCTSSQLPSTC